MEGAISDSYDQTIEEAEASNATQPSDGSAPAQMGSSPMSSSPPAASAEAIGVEFIILPENSSYRSQFPANYRVGDVFARLQEELKVDRSHLRFMFHGQDPDETRTLASLAAAETPQPPEINPDGTPSQPPFLQFETVIEYTDRQYPSESADGMAVTRVVTVEVVRENKKKPFLGGYRNKKNGLEYHHASMQTDRLPKQIEALQAKHARVLFHRETQTVDALARSQQTTREQGTQMSKAGLEIDESSDKIIYPKPYFDADSYLALREQKAIIIQAGVRAWFARQEAQRLRQEQYDAYMRRVQEEQERKSQSDEQKKKEIARRMHPKTKEDFDILFGELEAWRMSETKKIKEGDITEEERQKSMQELLRKETKLLQTIDRLRLTANKENREAKVLSTLEKMSSAKKLKNYDGKTTLVETPYTTRAAQLRDLYHGLCTPSLPLDQRLTLVDHVKYTVKEFDCQLTREITELADREVDMLNRGRSEKSLEGLRRRMNNLFLRFIETPEFNPEAVHFQRVPLEFLQRPLVQPIEN